MADFKGVIKFSNRIFSFSAPNLAGEHFNGVVRSSLLYFNVHTPLRDEYDVSQALIKIRVIEALKDKRPIDLANYGIEQQLQVFIDMVTITNLIIFLHSSSTYKINKYITR